MERRRERRNLGREGGREGEEEEKNKKSEIGRILPPTEDVESVAS